jgi:hypothetical protein
MFFGRHFSDLLSNLFGLRRGSVPIGVAFHISLVVKTIVTDR